MLLYPIHGYEHFKELFGLTEHGNGVKSRKNRILLSLLKHKPFIQWKNEMPKQFATVGELKSYQKLHFRLLGCESMSRLKELCLQGFDLTRYYQGCNSRIMQLNNRAWHSDEFRTDHMKGVTEDGDAASIRYQRQDTGKVYKMKAGKMYRKLIMNTLLGEYLPEQVIVWLCEELALEWQGYNTFTDRYRLHVDKEFGKIYNRYHCQGDFGSCMTGRDHHTFYLDAVNASAAYLTDREDKIVSRAIIYHDVEDEMGKKYNLLERQYSTGGDNILKQILVSRCIEAGVIDGYKRVGADCHNSRAFIAADGSDLSDKHFAIRCNLYPGDVLSYQDSFKWYDLDSNKAYNFKDGSGYTDTLDETEMYFQREENYDEYHDEYTSSDTVEVYYNGRWMSCSEDNLDDFEYVGNGYYHRDDCSYCPNCEEWFLSEDGYYSELTAEEYCCHSCQQEAEKEYCRRNPDDYVWLRGEAMPTDQVAICAFSTRLAPIDEMEYIEDDDVYVHQAFVEDYLKQRTPNPNTNE